MAHWLSGDDAVVMALEKLRIERRDKDIGLVANALV